MYHDKRQQQQKYSMLELCHEIEDCETEERKKTVFHGLKNRMTFTL